MEHDCKSPLMLAHFTFSAFLTAFRLCCCYIKTLLPFLGLKETLLSPHFTVLAATAATLVLFTVLPCSPWSSQELLLNPITLQCNIWCDGTHSTTFISRQQNSLYQCDNTISTRQINLRKGLPTTYYGLGRSSYQSYSLTPQRSLLGSIWYGVCWWRRTCSGLGLTFHRLRWIRANQEPGCTYNSFVTHYKRRDFEGCERHSRCAQRLIQLFQRLECNSLA